LKVLFHAQPVTKDWNKANKNMTYFLSQNKPFPLQYLLFIERRIAEFNDCSYKSLWHEVESQSHDLLYTSLGDLIDFLGCSLHFNDFVTCTFSLFELWGGLYCCWDYFCTVNLFFSMKGYIHFGTKTMYNTCVYLEDMIVKNRKGAECQ
jgi:hypothetical protein